MVAFVTRMLAGFAGQITRDPQGMVIESWVMTGTSGSLPAAYGVPICISSGLVVKYDATIADVYGILLRPFPIQSISTGFGSPVPVVNMMCDILRKGYFAAFSQYGTPAINGIVYVRKDTGGHGGTVGGFEVTSDTSHSDALTGAHWTGSGDTNTVCEISYNM